MTESSAVCVPDPSRAEAGQGWRPIASAPRDGTRVLLWAPHWYEPETGWTFGNDAWQDCRKDAHEREPTHWMPLPSPPTSQDGERDGSSLIPSPDTLTPLEGELVEALKGLLLVLRLAALKYDFDLTGSAAVEAAEAALAKARVQSPEVE